MSSALGKVVWQKWTGWSGEGIPRKPGDGRFGATVRLPGRGIVGGMGRVAGTECMQLMRE